MSASHNEEEPVHEKEEHEASGEDDESDVTAILQQMLGMRISKDKDKPDKPKVLAEVSFQGIVDYIKDGKAKNIITMAGAGISTSAGIPDFRSPGSGLYANLQKYELPYPEAIFAIDFFMKTPEPFFQLARELYPGHFNPTPCHYFIKLLEEKGLLLRHYTQNIDTLERVAGIPGDKIVEAHGTFHTAHCVDKSCKREYTQKWMKDQIFSDVVPTCERCNSLVKPDIIFFGEQLPERFFQCLQTDFRQCDLLIIMGTSLTVQPFASLIDRVGPECPRLLINKTKPGSDESDGDSMLRRLMGLSGGLNFDSENNYRDVAKIGTCDEGCFELAEKLGWKDELDILIKGQLSTQPDNEEKEVHEE